MTSREMIVLGVLGVLAASSAASAEPPAPSAPSPSADPIDQRLAVRLARLAEHHYRGRAYYRAISAYQELALFTDDEATRRHAAIRIAMSYHHGHQLDDALAAYQEALALGPDADTAQALRVQLAMARVERSLEQPGAEALDAIAAEITPSTTAGTYRALATVQLARIEGLAGRPEAARRIAGELRALCVRPAAGCDLEPALTRALARPAPARRSPWLGLAMSLVVPGAGSVYGGHYVDGAYYFALTTLAGLGALEVHDRSRGWSDQKATFYGLSTLAVVLYAGSALQGYVSVARRNAVGELEARRALWRATDGALPLDASAAR